MPERQMLKPLPIGTAPLDGSEVLVYFSLEFGPLAVTPAHFHDGTWWARGLDLPAPLYWLPLAALPDWPPDPSISDTPFSDLLEWEG